MIIVIYDPYLDLEGQVQQARHSSISLSLSNFEMLEHDLFQYIISKYSIS